jgi:predicted transcriptional regulator
MTTLEITIGNRKDRRDEALAFVQAAEADELNEADTSADDTRVLQFGSYTDYHESLPPRRLDLLETIATESPQSMREVARLVDRDVSDVHTDLKQLEVLGILTFDDGGPGGAMQPIVPFDRINIAIDRPLRSNNDPDDTPASV